MASPAAPSERAACDVRRPPVLAIVEIVLGVVLLGLASCSVMPAGPRVALGSGVTLHADLVIAVGLAALLVVHGVRRHRVC